MFLNNLDDFAMAIRMYTYANQPVSEGMRKGTVERNTHLCLYYASCILIGRGGKAYPSLTV